jgi:hypothetical protein
MVSWISTRYRGQESLIRTGEVPGSNLDSETGYPDSGFPWFSSVPPAKCAIVPQSRPRPLPSNSLFIVIISTDDTVLYSELLKASLNKT